MARKKAFIGAAISLGTSIVGGLMSSAAKRRQQEEQQRQQEAVYRAKEGSNRASSYNQQHANDYDLSLENERLYTSSLFKGGGSVNLKRKRNGIQENDAIKVDKPEISSKNEERRRKEGFRRYQSKRDATLLGIKTVAQILDPTGVSSYPDIAANYVKEGRIGNNTINSLLTAIPLLGTTGKAVSILTKGNRLRNRSGKVTGFLRDVNLYNNRKKFKPLVNTLFRLGGGTKLKTTKRATKQNLGLENANKTGVNAPTAYRNLTIESSQPNKTTLLSEDKVIQKALESAISTSPVKGIDDTRTTYKGGGKADVNNIITEGGDAKRIGHQTFLLRGRKHRNGGIVLGKGRNSIEAEGGEVVKIDKNTMKILSTVPMANGESPANRVLKGESPNKVFDSQEQFKDRNNMNNRRRKAALGDYLNLAGDAFNIISPLLGGSRTKRAINRMVAPTQPTQLQAANLRTTYNIQPQLTDVYNAEQQSIAETNRNTASSVAAQARGTRLRQLGLNQRNQLRGQQQNIETQLINQNRLNRQQVTNQNIAATNDWRDKVSQFVNDQIVSKANVDNQMLESVSSGIRDLQSRSDKNRQERNALTAIMASNPEQVNLFMKKRKEYEDLLDKNIRSLLRPYRCGGLVKRKMKR